MIQQKESKKYKYRVHGSYDWKTVPEYSTSIQRKKRGWVSYIFGSWQNVINFVDNDSEENRIRLINELIDNEPK